LNPARLRLVLVLVPGLLLTCPGCTKDVTFSKAVVERRVFKNGQPVMDASGRGKTERVTVSDRDEVARLASFFPGVGRGSKSGIAGGWKAGYSIVFDRADGGGTVNVTVNPEATTWSEVHGDWDAKPGLKEYLDKLFEDGTKADEKKGPPGG
jgi:hypothetical protein